MKTLLIFLTFIFLSHQVSFAQVEDTEPPIPEPPVTEEVFESWSVSKRAEFQGGMDALYKFIAKNMKFPEDYKSYNSKDSALVAQDLANDGIKIIVEFVINADGSISGIRSLGKNDEYLQPFIREATLVVAKMEGLWTPAEQRDKKVAMKFRLPIKFILQ